MRYLFNAKHVQGVLAVLRAFIAFSFLLLANRVGAQQATPTLAPITISGERGSTMTQPASTGSNLGLTLRQTPASLDVISREDIEERGDASITQAITWSTGFSAMPHPGNGLSALSVRGFSDSASVMRLYDGTALYGNVGITFPFDTWSVDRIETLRGPASVIYGLGAIGGVVNVIPKKPTVGPVENELQASVGSDNTQRLGLGSGGSLTDRLSYRVDLSGNRSDGWVDRGDNSDATFSGALQFDATPELSFRVSHAYGYQRPMQYFGTPLVDGSPQRGLRKTNYNVEDSVMRFRDQWSELAIFWRPNDDLTVSSRLYHVTSRRDWRNAEYYDYNAQTGRIDRSGNTQISHDQSQTGWATDATFKWRLAHMPSTFSIGFDLSRSRFQHDNNTYSGSSGSVDLYDPEPGYFRSDFAFIPRYRNKANQVALFAENRTEVTDRWSLVAGVRYDQTQLRRDDLVTRQQAFSKRYANVGWRLGTVYDLTADTAVYAQYSEAADPVGALLMLSPANADFKMTQGRQVEVGVKSNFWDDRGALTLSVYHIRKNNLISRDPINPSQSVQVGERSSRGVEASIELAVARHWRVQANATVLQARYDDFNESSGGRAVSRSGNVPPNVPQRLANVWVSWDFLPNWTAMGGLRYVGKRYADNANTLTLPSYTTTDLAIRWDVGTDTSITARGYNVFDKAYFTTAYYNTTQWLYGPGRRFELTLDHRF